MKFQVAKLVKSFGSVQDAESLVNFRYGQIGSHFGTIPRRLSVGCSKFGVDIVFPVHVFVPFIAIRVSLRR
ncbi:hypothetical protein Pla52n_17270 [Stieleria varia]|uniref:Uncharacterized protein n=1 Tax=Stieleria varia TaxID=2528005 RepID=A0A5C6B277_9BACT|nr:hypothetical protein Pla52n_17270 [Stieleria varia]